MDATAPPIVFAVTDLAVRAGTGWLGSRRTIIAGVSLVLHEGEVLAVLGRSGVGKTVMWRAMFGLSSPGLTVHYRERTPGLSEAGLERWRRSSVVFVHQGAQRSLDRRLTVEDYLGRLFRRAELPEARERFCAAAANLGLALAPHALGRTVGTFSGGETQRIALALRLAGRPRILVLDEPSAALDFGAAQQAKKLIATLVERFRIAVICVTHDYHFIAGLARRAIYLQRGESASMLDLSTGGGASAEAREWLALSEREAAEYARFFERVPADAPAAPTRLPIRMSLGAHADAG
jgi:ABC-type glutathione transport system ATPase component